MVAAGVGLATDIFVQNTNQLDIDVFGRTVTVAPGWLVVTGVVIAIAAVAGLLLIGKGFVRARARHKALRVAGRERDELARTLAAERAERERTDGPATSFAAPGPAVETRASVPSGEENSKGPVAASD